MKTLLCAAVVLASSVALAEQSEIEKLQTSDAPVRIDDAMTQQEAPLAQVRVLNSSDEGDEGVFIRPKLDVPLTPTTELGAEFEMSQQAEDFSVGALELHATQKLIKEEGLRPALSARLTGITPHEDVGVGGRAELLLTEKLGEKFRAHANAGYQGQYDAGDRYVGGVRADYAFGENLLLFGGGFSERQRDEEQTVYGAEGGASFKLGKSFVFHGMGGVLQTSDGTVPRFGIALTAG